MIINKENIKHIIFPGIVIIVLFSIILGIVMDIQNEQCSQITNYKIQSIIGEIKEKYPDVNEKEIIEILQNKESSQKGKELLEKYDYNEKDTYIQALKQQVAKNKISNIKIIIIFGICMIIMILIYLRNQNKKVAQINQYLKQINKKNYELKIEENTDDELSKLRNELYKTTVLLKETAENSKKESENLSNSLADISHQLKTPLTSIRIMIDNIYENPDMDENTRKDFLKTISTQLEWISFLVISLLKLAKFDAGTITMNDNEISANELIKEAINNLSILLDLKNISIEYGENKNAKFVADYKWQLEAISNIIKNSIEHSYENSKIYIKLEDSSVFLKIIIKDEGEGINEKDIKHIFQRFYKAENSSENSIGIGLSLSKAIIEKDNGYITVSSEKGKGSIFEIKYLK